MHLYLLHPTMNQTLHPKSEDFFTNSTGGESVAVEFNEINNPKSFFDLILENKNKKLLCILKTDLVNDFLFIKKENGG